MKTIRYFTLASFLVLPTLGYPGCGAINIVITNASPNLCKLVTSTLKHGYYDYVSSAPTYIPANSSSSPIILSQSFLGSELELTYMCGKDKTITLVNHHHYKFFSAGNVDGHVAYSKNMRAESHALRGSCLWNEHGSLDWLIE